MGYPLLVASKANGHNGPKVPGHKVRTGKVVASGLAGDDVVTLHAEYEDLNVDTLRLTAHDIGGYIVAAKLKTVRAVRTGTSGSEVFIDVE